MNKRIGLMGDGEHVSTALQAHEMPEHSNGAHTHTHTHHTLTTKIQPHRKPAQLFH